MEEAPSAATATVGDAADDDDGGERDDGDDDDDEYGAYQFEQVDRVAGVTHSDSE